jgi:hypothetical protein
MVGGPGFELGASRSRSLSGFAHPSPISWVSSGHETISVDPVLISEVI